VDKELESGEYFMKQKDRNRKRKAEQIVWGATYILRMIMRYKISFPKLY